MEWAVAAVIADIATVLFFTRQSFLARCPVCGVMALHPRNSAGEAQRETYALMKRSGLLNSLDKADS